MSHSAACAGKKRYSTIAEAEKRIVAIQEQPNYDDKLPLNAYQCRFCSNYHVGHDPKKSSDLARSRGERIALLQKEVIRLSETEVALRLEAVEKENEERGVLLTTADRELLALDTERQQWMEAYHAQLEITQSQTEEYEKKLIWAGPLLLRKSMALLGLKVIKNEVKK